MISKGLGLLAQYLNGNSNSTQFSLKSKSERIITYFAFSFILFNLYFGFFESPNIFQKLNVSLESPGFELRNAFRIYVNKRMEQDVNFDQMIKLKGFKDDDSDYELKTEYVNLEKEYNELKYLMNEMKSISKRSFYFRFGEKAFQNCEFCTEDFDYLLFVTPSVLLSYFSYLIILGFLTYSKAKSKWFPLGILSIAILVAIEFMVHFGSNLVQPDLYDFFFDAMQATRFQKMEFVRRCVISVFTLIILLFDNGDPSNQLAEVNEIIKMNAEMLNLSHAIRLQKTAVLQDSVLRKEFFDYYRKQENERSQLVANPELQKYQKELLHKYDLDALIKEATETVDNFVNEGIQN